MEDYVADVAAPPMEAAASSSNSELPAILMILPNDHRLLQKLQHILLLQRTFETFLNCTQKRKNVNKNKIITVILIDTSVKML
jgi:hypothetical protein